MSSRAKGLAWIPVLALLFVIARLGSLTFALGVGGLIASLVLVTHITRPKVGQPRVKKAPTLADAELQRWGTGGF